MRSGTATKAVIAVAGAVLTLVVLGAAVGGSWVLEEPRFDLSQLGADRPAELEPQEPPSQMPELVPDDVPDEVNLAWLNVVAAVVAVAVALLLGRRVLRWWAERRGRPRESVAPELDPDAMGEVTEPSPPLPELQDAAEAARRSLADLADPADAVIAAWVALEDAASTSGVARRPAQTPTELTVAVLERTDADRDAVAELLALYHRARFSDRPMDRDAVARAIACIDRLAADWDAMTATNERRP